MKKSRNIHFHIQGGYNQILPNAETGAQNAYGIQTIASYKKKGSSAFLVGKLGKIQ